MLKAVIFDMDGVLINTEPFHYELWKDTFAQHGLVIDYDHYKGCIGSTAGYLMELIYKEYGVDFRGNKEIMKEQQALKAERVRQGGIPKIDGVPEMIERISRGDYDLAVASSSPQYYIELAMSNLGINHYFEKMISGEGVDNPKPAPDVFLKAAQLLKVKPEECLVVEDSVNGCRAAVAAGMVCVGYANPDSGDQDLSCADAIIDDYSYIDVDSFIRIYENACNVKQNSIQ